MKEVQLHILHALVCVEVRHVCFKCSSYQWVELFIGFNCSTKEIISLWAHKQLDFSEVLVGFICFCLAHVGLTCRFQLVCCSIFAGDLLFRESVCLPVLSYSLLLSCHPNPDSRKPPPLSLVLQRFLPVEGHLFLSTVACACSCGTVGFFSVKMSRNDYVVPGAIWMKLNWTELNWRIRHLHS